MQPTRPFRNAALTTAVMACADAYASERDDHVDPGALTIVDDLEAAPASAVPGAIDGGIEPSAETTNADVDAGASQASPSKLDWSQMTKKRSACVLAAALHVGALGCTAGASAQDSQGGLALIDDAGGADAGDVGALDGSASDAGVAPLDGGLDGGGGPAQSDGLTFSEVVANGSGCPSGTWATSLSDDGKSFTMTFTSFEIEVEPESSVAAKSCALSVRLRSPRGTSVALKTLRLSGYAFLEQGVTARVSARYWFRGNPIADPDHDRFEIVGPYDGAYVFHDDLRLEDMVWSTCSRERDLNIDVRIVLVDTSPAGSGYVNVEKLPGDATADLLVRRCDDGISPSAISAGDP